MVPTILLVEDNPITRKLVRFALENNGLGVVDAPDGATALEAFAQNPVALVLQDLLLPDLDGFELVSRLRALPGGADVPILAFSGLLSKLEEAKISVVGFDDVISKPIEPSRLLQIVRTHLPPAEGASSPDLFGKGHRMIVADDDPVQRKLVAFRMQKVGFEVLLAADGVEALERAQSVVPDAVVSDVLMPRLDGFGLCINIRRDARLARIPVVLMTNSYVEPPDRELARKAGANDLVLRTPELRELMETVRASLGTAPPPLHPAAPDAEIEGERMRRVMRQLERQVSVNAGVTQRCALLSAELAVLNGISGALASDDDIDSALRHALAACFDAGGVSLGALYLAEQNLRVLSFGLSPEWSDEELSSFFGERDILERALRTKKTIAIPSSDVSPEQQQRLLERANASSALIVPLVHKKRALGVLLMMSRTLETIGPDRIMFGEAVAGQIAQALAVTRAFAEKQASERVANEQAAVLRSILESIADGVMVADEQGRFIHWNPAAEAIMRTGPRDTPPEQWSKDYGFLEPDQVTPIATEQIPLIRAMRGDSVDSMEVFVRHDRVPDGAWLSMNARPWRVGTGTIRGGVAAFRDVTQEKAAQSQLMISDRMASVGMLAAGVAHEINNPLAVVLANLDVAQRAIRDAAPSTTLGEIRELREMIEDARNAADRVRYIVRDLKIFSRHEEVPAGAVDIQRVLESSLRMAWNEIRHRSRLVREYGEVPLVEGTESRLGQVILNLIVNAAQAIPEGNAEENIIRVATRSDPSGQIAVEISDTGTGIPPQILPRLFTPFFTTKAAGVGTGLGLAICHRIVTGLGGEIQVESEVGRGTTFTVLLPAAKTTEVGEKQPVPRTARASRRARVLVIDDEPLIGAAIRRTFASEHEVFAITRASEALARIAAGETFDVILCDLMMPQMTGMEFHAALRQTGSAHADGIIFLVGGAFTPAARAFLDQVPNERVEKPFDAQHLRDLIENRIK